MPPPGGYLIPIPYAFHKLFTEKSCCNDLEIYNVIPAYSSSALHVGGYQGDHMLENYFYDKTGFEQKDEVKREKAVAAVLEILKVSASHSANHVVITSLKNEISEAADAIQKALDKQ